MKAVDQSLAKNQTDGLGTFWTLPPEAICATLHCGLEGLSSDDAKRRLAQYVEFIFQVGIVIALNEISDLGDVHHEQDDVRHMDLPGALDKACAADHEPALEHHPRVDEGSRITRDENEQIGGIAEPVIALSDPVNRRSSR